jgi:hypothetical protein
VSSAGVITAVSLGTATITITATAPGNTSFAAATVTELVTVSVAPAVADVQVTPGTASLMPGSTQQLTATVRDSSGAALSGRAVTWSTSNPAIATVSATGLVTAVAVGTGRLPRADGGVYAVAQLAGGVAGVWLAHAMFGLAIVQVSAHARDGAGQWISEVVATAGLLLTVEGAARHRPQQAPLLVMGWVVAAYWFTASTAFANPAVTVARAWTDTFAGIRPADVPGFVGAQGVGAAVGWALARALNTEPQEGP